MSKGSARCPPPRPCLQAFESDGVALLDGPLDAAHKAAGLGVRQVVRAGEMCMLTSCGGCQTDLLTGAHKPHAVCQQGENQCKRESMQGADECPGEGAQGVVVQRLQAQEAAHTVQVLHRHRPTAFKSAFAGHSVGSAPSMAAC